MITCFDDYLCVFRRDDRKEATLSPRGGRRKNGAKGFLCSMVHRCLAVCLPTWLVGWVPPRLENGRRGGEEEVKNTSTKVVWLLLLLLVYSGVIFIRTLCEKGRRKMDSEQTRGFPYCVECTKSKTMKTIPSSFFLSHLPSFFSSYPSTTVLRTVLAHPVGTSASVRTVRST